MSIACCTLALAAACVDEAPTPSTQQDAITAPARPAGVYAHVSIAKAIGDGYAPPGSNAPSGLTLRGLYKKLLHDPAVSGLVLGVDWDLVDGTQAPALDLSTVDAAFQAALDEDRGQKIVLSLSPGIHLPYWFVHSISVLPTPFTSCDGWFDGGKASTTCGGVTFESYPEQKQGVGQTIFPVPWNDRYQKAWASFLGQVASYYSETGPHPEYAPLLVGVAIAGPTGVSPELIYPNRTDKPQPVDPVTGTPGPTTGWYDYSDQHGVWNTLIAKQLPPGTTAENAFVGVWDQAIDTYEGAFSGITLILSPDDGHYLPVFAATATPLSTHLCGNDDANGNPDPNGVPNASCQANAEIIDHLFTVQRDAIALQMGGLTANTPIVANDGLGTPGIGGNRGDLTVPGIKYVLAHPGLANVPMTGGALFDHALTTGSDGGRSQDIGIGCPPGAPKSCAATITPEEAMYNLLSVYFYATPGAQDFDAPAVQPIPAPSLAPRHMSYVLVDYADVLYALGPDPAVNVDGVCVSAEYMLELSSYWLGTGARPMPLPPC